MWLSQVVAKGKPYLATHTVFVSIHSLLSEDQISCTNTYTARGTSVKANSLQLMLKKAKRNEVQDVLWSPSHQPNVRGTVLSFPSNPADRRAAEVTKCLYIGIVFFYCS